MIPKNITREHIIKAIEEINEVGVPPNRESRDFHLEYEGKYYPPKYVISIANRYANGRELQPSEFNGGYETNRFLEKRGFKIIEINSGGKSEKNTQKTSRKRLSPVDQKIALQKLLQKNFGVIVTEKKFDWLKAPDPEHLPEEYKKIVDALIAYRGHKDFYKKSYHPPCDIVLEDQKIIIEYDENQHFTNARKITLENYPENVKLYFNKDYWIEQCDKINAHDNDPQDRDEGRAYYDAIRDIEAFKHGYKLIRIKHGDFDWTSEDAIEHLREMINQLPGTHKIARIIVSGKQYKGEEPILDELKKVFVSFVQDAKKKDMKFEFVITPGGFLRFDWPSEFDQKIDEEEGNKNIQVFYKSAEQGIDKFFDYIGKNTLEELKGIADYLTIGIDSKNYKNDQRIELVAIFDLKASKVIRWTGKFYPTGAEERHLIRIYDLDSHFITLNNQKVVVLGCHDLNAFNPRGQAVSNPDGWRKKTADEFKERCKEFKPDIILHHPHNTDTPNIWRQSWIAIQEELPEVKHYASGIRYYNRDGKTRGELNEVLDKTKKGDVVDFNYAE